jgi:hypothetical protein
MPVSRGPMNYTTTIDADKSAMECLHLLRKHGASHVGIAFGGAGEPDGIEFVIATPWGPQQFSLSVNAAGTQKALMKAWRDRRVERRYTTPEQAARVAWRVMRDWLESQLALYEAGLVDLPQALAGFMRVEPGKTLWAAVVEQRMLEAGPPP